MKTSYCLSSCNTFNYAFSFTNWKKMNGAAWSLYRKKKQPRWLKKNCIIENIMPILLESFNQTFLLIMTQFFNLFFSIPDCGFTNCKKMNGLNDHFLSIIITFATLWFPILESWPLPWMESIFWNFQVSTTMHVSVHYISYKTIQSSLNCVLFSSVEQLILQ